MIDADVVGVAYHLDLLLVVHSIVKFVGDVDDVVIVLVYPACLPLPTRLVQKHLQQNLIHEGCCLGGKLLILLGFQGILFKIQPVDQVFSDCLGQRDS